MKRRLFTILSALSLLLFVAVVGLWVRSYWRADVAVRYWRSYDGDASHSLMIQAHEGQLTLSREVWQRGGPAGATMSRWAGTKPYIDLDPSERQWGIIGIQWHSFDRAAAAIDGWTLVIPIWMVVVPAVAFALLCPCRVSTLRAPRDGLCPSCNYDLRATPGRCPECGLVPAAPPLGGMSNDQRPMTKE